MKTALLHYWLLNMYGGEKVLAALAEMFPDADVFTHALGRAMCDPPQAGGEGRRWRGHAVRESLVAHLPLGRRCPQAYLPLMPWAGRHLDLSAYDLVISSESGPIKGVAKRAGQHHVCYCHTPMRYVWDMNRDYYEAAGPCGKLAMRLCTPYMRREDLRSAEGVDLFVANSRFVAERIRRIYGRDAAVVHPPVDVQFFGGEYEKEDYCLFVGRLTSYKRPDLAIAACARMGQRILVVGEGDMRTSLERAYAGNPLVAFLGAVDDTVMKSVYGRARALVFPGVEDFGIVPVEAQAAGTPVIAYGRGGALETVVEGRTGVFFREQSVGALCAALEEFDSRHYRAEDCRANAANFTKERFASAMRTELSKLIG